MPKQNVSIADLVQGFAKHIRALKSPETKEAQVRLQYIDRFWHLLGWDVQNQEQRAPQDVEVVVEPSMDSVEDGGLRSREPDYLFRLNGFARFIVEAKKPSVDLDDDTKAIFQAKRYAWNAAIPFAVLTDFEQFRLFDTTLKPILNDPRRGLVKEFKLGFEDYEAQWDVLTSTFGREAVAGGSLEALRAGIRKVPAGRRLRAVDRMLIDLKGDEPVDRVFLAYLDAHRKHLAREIYRNNRKFFPEADTLHGAARLTEAVQRLMDRLVFMRVCEDRGVAEWGGLRDTLERIGSEGGELYAALCNEFRDLDRSYNGYLFKPHFSEELNVDGNVLADFIRTLYPPDGPWDFSAIADDILGIVYERFLGNVVTVKQHQAEVEEKPEVRHAGGVYYTPRFVVDTIIRRVVGPKIKDKTPAEVLDIKILDPACGSGSFLVAAFQYLMDHCLAAVQANPALATMPATPRARKKRREIAFKDRQNKWILAPDFRAALLASCLHGVDIDQQAVEVTVMSLYLKMLEGELPPHWQRDWLENQLLPPMDNNIHCGNSLIDSDDFDRYVTDKYGGLFPMDDDVQFRINRFDWRSRTGGFGRLLDSQAVKERGRQGFDCIIGNPPYIRVQELNKWAEEECEFYKWKYKSAAKGNYDIYVVFVEKCLSLLASDGLLGFIMPHKFWQAKYGEGLRKIIADGKHLRAVVDFAHQQVFQGATTYTAIHVLGRKPNSNGVHYARFDDLTDGVTQCISLDVRQKADGVVAFDAPMPSGEAPWRVAPPATMKVYEAVASIATMTLGDAASRLFQGVRTSKNEVFVLRVADTKRGMYVSELLGHQVELEPGLLKPFLDGDCIRRYSIEPATAVAIFPYSEPKARGGVDLLAAEEISAKYPKTWDYLKGCEKVLRAREHGRMDTDAWYAYGRTQNLDLFGIPRVLVPDMMDRAAFAVDEDGGAAFVSGYGIILKDKYRKFLAYFAGLLNSTLLSEYLKSVSTPLRGGWYRTFPQFLRQVPIKIPMNAEEGKLAAKITELVRAIMEAKGKLRVAQPEPGSGALASKSGTLSDREMKSLLAEVEAQERRIDEAVCRLYKTQAVAE